MELNVLKKWLSEFEAKKITTDKQIELIKALIVSASNQVELEENMGFSTPIKTSEKINKKNEIFSACQNMKNAFTSKDVKRFLERSENQEVRGIKLVYISGQLCKFANEQKIRLVQKGKTKKEPNIYSSMELVSSN